MTKGFFDSVGERKDTGSGNLAGRSEQREQPPLLPPPAEETPREAILCRCRGVEEEI